LAKQEHKSGSRLTDIATTNYQPGNFGGAIEEFIELIEGGEDINAIYQDDHYGLPIVFYLARMMLTNFTLILLQHGAKYPDSYVDGSDGKRHHAITYLIPSVSKLTGLNDALDINHLADYCQNNPNSMKCFFHVLDQGFDPDVNKIENLDKADRLVLEYWITQYAIRESLKNHHGKQETRTPKRI